MKEDVMKSHANKSRSLVGICHVTLVRKPGRRRAGLVEEGTLGAAVPCIQILSALSLLGY